MANKLPSDQENPYDALLLQISEALLPIMHDTGSGFCAKDFQRIPVYVTRPT